MLEDEGHGGALVQNTELALGALLVGGVGEDTSVQKCSVGIGNHGTNVTRAVRLAVGLSLLEGVEVVNGGLLPVERVTLVDGVDGARLGHLHVGMRQDELADAVVEREAVDSAALHGHDELRRGTVHGETGSDELGARHQDVLLGSLGAFGKLVDGENGTNRHTSVQVGGTVNRIARDGVTGTSGVLEDDDVFLFLRNKESALARVAHGCDEEVVGKNIELLLLVTSGVGRTGQTGQVDEGRATDVVGDGLERVLEGVAKETEGTVSNVIRVLTA